MGSGDWMVAVCEGWEVGKGDWMVAGQAAPEGQPISLFVLSTSVGSVAGI